MNAPLRNSLWNLIRELIPPDPDRLGMPAVNFPMVQSIVVNVLRVPVENIDASPRRWLYYRIQEVPWDTVYDTVQFLADSPNSSGTLYRGITPADFRKKVNQVLEAENAAYRFVGGELTELTSPTDAAAIEQALDQAEAHGLAPVREHLQQSLALLGKRPEPDYRNAIKEAISAVESAANLILNRKGTLGEALDGLAQTLPLHGALKSALGSLYGFTSDGSGIRHGLREESTVNGTDARLMVLTCSALVTWLITKADEAGMLKSS